MRRSPRASTRARWIVGAIGIGLMAGAGGRVQADPGPHRSPIALGLARGGTRALTANQTAGTASWVDLATGRVLDETPTGDRPGGAAIDEAGARGVVSNWYGYDLAILRVEGDRLRVDGRVEVGPEPRGVALSPDGRTAYVAVGASDEVVRVDLDRRAVTGRLGVGREPRGLAITPDGARLAVGNARSRSISIVDLAAWKVERTRPMEGENLRQVAIDPKGTYAHVANMRNRGFATTRNNIDIGWVLGQRVTRVPIAGAADSFETLSLDPEGKAAGDAHGLAISTDGSTTAVGLGGTHEVMLFSEADRPLPWRANGSRDLIDGSLLRPDGRLRRIPLGGRPTEVAFTPDGRSLVVANYLLDSVQVVDVGSGSVARSIPLGGPSEPSSERRGEALFHDATRSFNQWYSCNTCHSDGHTNGNDFDTMNDGWQDLSTRHEQSRKKVPTLRRVVHTGPWTWHGWQGSLDDATVESFTKSMQGTRPTDREAADVVAFLATLDYPRNPNVGPDGAISPAAERGRAVFRSAKAACNTCHRGPEFTDGKVHEVGLESRRDVYKGYNPPSLRGVYDKAPYLHDGRAKTLREALQGDHDPDDMSHLGSLDEAELSDLVEYLRTL